MSENKKKKCVKKDLVPGELYALRCNYTYKRPLDECPVVMYLGPSETETFARVLYCDSIVMLSWDSFYHIKESDDDDQSLKDLPLVYLPRELMRHIIPTV